MQKMNELVTQELNFDVYSNLKNKISDNKLHETIIPYIVERLMQIAALPQTQLSLLIRMILQSLDSNFEEIKTQKDLKNNLQRLINPMIKLCAENRWLADLKNLSFTTPEVKKFAENFAKKYQFNSKTIAEAKPEKKNTLFDFLQDFLNDVEMIREAFPAANFEKVLFTIFSTLVPDLPDYNPPSDELLLRLEMLSQLFENYSVSPTERDAIHNIEAVQSSLKLLKKFIYARKADLEGPILTHKKLMLSLSGESIYLQAYLNTKINYPDLMTTVIELTEAIENSADLKAIFSLFNNFTKYAVALIAKKPEFGDVLRAYERTALQCITFRYYRVTEESQHQAITANLVKNVGTITAREAVKDGDVILTVYEENLKELILTHMNSAAMEPTEYLQKVTAGLFSDQVEEQEQAKKLLRNPNYRKFTDHPDAINRDYRKIRDENIAKIEDVVEQAKHAHYVLQDSILQIINFELSSTTQKNIAQFDNDRENYKLQLLSTNKDKLGQVKAEVQKLSTERQRVFGVITRIEILAKDLNKADTKDKADKLFKLASDLKSMSNNYYRAINVTEQDKFKTNLVNTISSTFESVGNHRREWAKRLEVALVNAILCIFSIPKRVFTGSWIINMNTNTQNKLDDTRQDIQNIFQAKP